MSYALYGFLFGFVIPYIARRFSKFMPATPAYAIYRILKPVKMVSPQKRKANPVYQKLLRKYFMRSLGWAIVCAALSYLYAAALKGNQNLTVCYIGFIWVLLLLSEIDRRMFLLPDILTFPLLIAGFLCASLSCLGTFVSPFESSIGATVGFLLPVVSSAFLIWKNKDALGGGDIKLFAAIGAWLGVEHLLYVVILSCFVFAVEALIKKQRVGAFGPSMVVAAIIVSFLAVSGIL